MRCLVCGYEMPNQAKFCRNCGTRVEDMLGQTETVVAEHDSSIVMEPLEGHPQEKENKQSDKKKLVFIAVGAAVLLFVGVLLGISLMNKDANESSGDPMDYYDENYEIVDDYDDNFDNTVDDVYNEHSYNGNEESDYQVPENHTYDVQVAVSDYLETYIEDVQYGAYNKLYSVVERGSNMEKTQEKFISSCNLYEELLGYTYIDTTQIDSSTYHVTTTERYEIYSYESDVQ